MEEKKVMHEQDVVLAVKGKSVIVSASAGSGKTRTMINKIYKTMVEERVDISSILVLTYTDAAATEMKSRLNALLTDKLAAEENVEFLQNQIDKLSVADISTFHSFYEKLIRSNYYYLNINPAFKILEDAEIEILKETAFQNAMNLFKRDEERYLELFSAFGKKNIEKNLKKRIYKLYNFLSAQQDDEEWIEKTALNLVKNFAETKKIVNDFYNDNLEYAIGRFQKILVAAEAVGQLKIVDHLNKIISDLSSILRHELEVKQDKLINEFSFPVFSFKKDIDLELVDEVKKVKENFNKFVRKVKDENLSFDKKFCAVVQKEYALFLELYKSFARELADLKRNACGYDFSDLEKMALKLLENKIVQEKVKDQYRYIFVDEFQDVNSLQNGILNLIAKENNTFIVGDPKQSIYAFRQSDVELFNSMQEVFEKSEHAESLSLINNYRSNKKILDFCNKIFSIIMTEKTTNLNYKETSLFQSDEVVPYKFEPVNFLLMPKREKETAGAVEMRYSVFGANRVKESFSGEVQMIYSKISDLIGEKIYDKDLKQFRPIRFGDIAVLVRNRGPITDGLSQLFEAHGVPYVLNAEKDLKKSKLVLAVIAALRVAGGYYSDVDLATVLNRFFNFSYQELAGIKLQYSAESFSNSVELCLSENSVFAEKLSKFKEIMQEFKFQISISGIFFAINYLIKNSYFDKFKGEVDGADEEGQILDSFFKFIQEGELDNNLTMLLKIIDENQELKVEQNCSAGLDQVAITTMHSSKGLEYPIVFLAGLNSSLMGRKLDESDIKIHKKLGIALKTNSLETSVFEKAIKINERKESLAENLRLLYVGMTRAKNHLFICAEAELSKIEKVDENNILFAGEKYINYIVGAIDELGRFAINNARNYTCEEYKVEIFDVENFQTNFNREEGFSLSEEDKRQVIKEINKLNSAVYENESAKFISQKTSVTEIVSESEDFGSVCGDPKDFAVVEHLTGVKSSVDMGIAIHEIMERADLSISDDMLRNICVEVYEKYLELGVVLSEDFAMEAQRVCRMAINKIAGIISENSKTYREKKFMINASRKDVFGEGDQSKVLIQGVIDFFAVGEKVILIDYKYSKIKDSAVLKNRYENQLKIYSYALEKFLNKKVDECYLLNLSNGDFIKF